MTTKRRHEDEAKPRPPRKRPEDDSGDAEPGQKLERPKSQDYPGPRDRRSERDLAQDARQQAGATPPANRVAPGARRDRHTGEELDEQSGPID